MGTRFRLLLIFLGALAIIATYTFPIWQPFFEPVERNEDFPGLEESLQEAYLSLSTRERTLYLTMLRDEGSTFTLPILRAAIGSGTQVPINRQIRPDVQNGVQIASTEFQQIALDDDFYSDFIDDEDASPYRDLWEAEGEITVWQFPAEDKLIWIQDLVVTNGPDLHIGLSVNPVPLSFENMGENYFDLGALQGNSGNQGYLLGGDVDFEIYNSVVIFDETYRVVFAVAPF